MNLTIENIEEMHKITKALGSADRLKILEQLNHGSMNLAEISEKLSLPLSTVSHNIGILKNANLINISRQPGIRGSMCLCSRKTDDIVIKLSMEEKNDMKQYYMDMPIGHYTDSKVHPICGLANYSYKIGFEDEPNSFYDLERVTAQILWFRHGYVEYRFSNQILLSNIPYGVELSFEACSEAPNYRNNWPSDITLWVNNVEIGTWTSPGDFGGRKGKLNPPWWPSASTQYGILKTWHTDTEGSFIDGAKVSDVVLSDLKLSSKDHIAVRIGVKKDAQNPGGFNLFGEKFGDYNQNILMRIDYKEKV